MSWPWGCPSVSLEGLAEFLLNEFFGREKNYSLELLAPDEWYEEIWSWLSLGWERKGKQGYRKFLFILAYKTKGMMEGNNQYCLI